jgi:hypothetical protein
MERKEKAMDLKFFFIAGLLLFGGILLSACASMIPVSGDPQATQNAAAFQAAVGTATQSALETEIAVLRTQVAQVTPDGGQAATATPAPVMPTATLEPPAATATQIPVLPTFTPTTPPLPCNAALFMGDISIPDGSVLTPGTSFTKTWRFQNAGACTWTTSYALVYVDGNRLGGPDEIALPGNVYPGQVIDVSVDLVSPGQAGSYRGDWMLRDASGVQFGIGRKNGPVYVDIQVAESVSSYPLDFVASYCQAEWTSGAGRLPCQGRNNDSRGYVRRIDNPTLESGSVDDEPVLLTQPQMITDGVIRGKYPAIHVEAGYHFAAVIGCAYEATACDVKFRLDYQIGSDTVGTLASWNEVYDKEFHLVDVDLSRLAGQDVKFILTVIANGASSQNRAQWLAPHISLRDVIVPSAR